MTLSVAIHTVDDLVTPVASLSETFDKAISPRLNDAGSGTFSILLDNDDASDVQFGRVAIITDSDSSTGFGFVIESQRRKVLDVQGASRQVNVVSGRMLPALLERAVVYPEGGANVGQTQDVRVFNWANPAYDDSSWTAATALVQQGTNPNASSQWGPPYQDELLPRNWQDGSAYWMGPSVGDWEDAPDRQWYLRWKFTLADAGSYLLDFAVDNDALVWIDGVLVFEGGASYWEAYSLNVDLAAGDHVVAARIWNAPKVDNNPSAFLGTLWSTDGGERDNVIERTNGAADVDVLNTPTVSGVHGSKFQIPTPGMTVGKVMDLLLDEAQARDALDGWTWDFSATADSASTAWPTEAEITVKVGDDYLTVLRQLAQTYIDFKVDYDDLVLHAYVKGDLGSASGVSFTEGSSVSDLSAEGEG